MMYHVPGIEGCTHCATAWALLSRRRLPIGRDGRNRPSLFPFGTATGRNAHAKSPYNAHAGMRAFMVSRRDAIGAYLDWRTQEVGVAAALSGDTALMDAYRAGDIYHALARVLRPHRKIRTRRVGRRQSGDAQPHEGAAARRSPTAWAWRRWRGLRSSPADCQRDHRAPQANLSALLAVARRHGATAMLERRIESVFGWPLHISTSPNQRTLYNFPMQAGGAEMLRLATMRLCDAGIVPIMLVHDGILFEDDEPRADRTRQGDHARRRPRHLRRPRDRRRRRPAAGERRALPRQAADGTADVGDGDGRAACDQSGAEKSRGMRTRHITRHGRRFEVETLDTGIGPNLPSQKKFVVIPLYDDWGIRAMTIAGRGAAAIVLHALYVQNTTGQGDVPITAALLRRHGLTRKMRWITINRLVGAGFSNRPLPRQILRLSAFDLVSASLTVPKREQHPFPNLLPAGPLLLISFFINNNHWIRRVSLTELTKRQCDKDDAYPRTSGVTYF